MKHPLPALAAAVCCLATALPAAAQFQKPEDAIKYRHSAMTLQAAHFGRVAAMASGRAPYDAQAAAENASIARTMSTIAFAGFAPGSEKGAPTRAKPDIWTDTAEFKKYADQLQTAMAKLEEVARAGGGADALKGPVGDVGKLCKGCHDDFRNEKLSN
jgi:cytochrome c556